MIITCHYSLSCLYPNDPLAARLFLLCSPQQLQALDIQQKWRLPSTLTKLSNLLPQLRETTLDLFFLVSCLVNNALLSQHLAQLFLRKTLQLPHTQGLSSQSIFFWICRVQIGEKIEVLSENLVMVLAEGGPLVVNYDHELDVAEDTVQRYKVPGNDSQA